MGINIVENNFNFGLLTNRSKTTGILYHHVAGTMTVQAIHNMHKNTNGWAGIGYHFVVDKDGYIYRGRPIGKVGSHATGYNSNAVGICFNGNFDLESMPEAQKNAGKALTAYVKGLYPAITWIKRHRDVAATACPGKNFPFDEIKSGQANTGAVTTPGTSAGTSTSDKGTVLYFQQWLNKTYGFGIKEDNKFGPETKKASIKALQTELNRLGETLAVDGGFGPLTRVALARHNIFKGQAGNLVRLVQGLCICHGCSVGASGIDGSFGADTDKGVRKFQGAKRIKADGIVGSGTFGKFLA